MGKLSRFHKVIYLFNILAVALLLVACVVPHVEFSFLTFLGLSVPVLVLANLLFFLFWLVLRKKKQTYASLSTLVFAFFILGSFFQFRFSDAPTMEEDLSLMSYNVRVFNRNEDIASTTIFEDIKAFIEQENPDIICFQEPDPKRINEYDKYPYHYLEDMRGKGKGHVGILSKYPIIRSGIINFPQTQSNGCFADIQYQNDTIRVYNVHLESLGITPGNGTLRSEPSDKLFKQLNEAFQKQKKQAEILREHMSSTKHRILLCADLNNSQFSNVYKTIKGDLQDTFVEEGRGYGRTYSFHGLPVRIDFIMADASFEVKSHKTYDVKFSDHFPITASFQLLTEL